MGFKYCLSQRFTEESIHKNAPAVPGVYGLSNAQHWLYIGESNDIRASLLAHLGKALTPEPGNDPTGYAWEPVPTAVREVRKQYLIGELSPTCQGGTPARRSGRIRRGGAP